MNPNDYILSVPDFPKKGIVFYDITPLLAEPEAYRKTLEAMAEKISENSPTKIMAAESRGFFFGPALAVKLGLPFVPVRKKGKLPRETIDADYELEYGVGTLCVHRDGVVPGDRPAVVDDVLATGGTAKAMCEIAYAAGAHVACCAFLLELKALGGRRRLSEYPVVSLFDR